MKYEVDYRAQLSLGDMIDLLKQLPSDALVQNLQNPHSYRGYYEELAFVPESDYCTAGELLELAKSCVGKTYYGWKGGEFKMSLLTPVWVAQVGNTGEMLKDIAVRTLGQRTRKVKEKK